MTNDITELIWYIATFFGSGMLVLIWWVIRQGFSRLIKIIDSLVEKVDNLTVDMALTKQKLESHIDNASLHVERRVN